MSIFYTTYPISVVFIFVVLCILFVISLTNIVLASVFLWLTYMDCISITPIIKIVDDTLGILFKDSIATVKHNIKESFPVFGNTEYKGQAIFIFHPHGIFSLAHTFHVICNTTDWPYKRMKATVHAIMGKIPLIKDFHNNICIPSNYETMKDVLLDGKSLSLGLGGRTESRIINRNKITAVIKSRRGIFKMALETGVPLIPVISYGENNVYQKMDSSISDCIEYLIGFNIPIPTLESLKAWFQIYKTPLKEPIKTYIGEPITMSPPVAKPTDAQIEELRSRYIAAIEKLYRETRPEDYEAELEVV